MRHLRGLRQFLYVEQFLGPDLIPAYPFVDRESLRQELQAAMALSHSPLTAERVAKLTVLAQ